MPRRDRFALWSGLSALAAALACVRFALPSVLAKGNDIKAPGDGFWLIRNALKATGADQVEATRAALALWGPWRWDSRPGGWQQWVDSAMQPRLAISDRYTAIFESRPGLSWLLAPFLEVLGPAAIPLFAILMGAVAAVLMAVFAVMLSDGTGRRSAWITGSVAIVCFMALPTGMWGTEIHYEGGAYAAMIATAAVALAATRPHARARRAAWLLGPVALVAEAVKSSYATPLAILLCLILATAGCFDSGIRKSAFLAAASALAAAIVWQLIVIWRGWPGIGESLQDTFTEHFTKPDVPHPVSKLIALLQRSTHEWLDWLAQNPVVPLIVVCCFAYLLLRIGWRATIPLSIAVVGVLNVLLHPFVDQTYRLISPIWIPVAAATALAVRDLVLGSRGLLDRRADGREQAVEPESGPESGPSPDVSVP